MNLNTGDKEYVKKAFIAALTLSVNRVLYDTNSNQLPVIGRVDNAGYTLFGTRDHTESLMNALDHFVSDNSEYIFTITDYSETTPKKAGDVTFITPSNGLMDLVTEFLDSKGVLYEYLKQKGFPLDDQKMVDDFRIEPWNPPKSEDLNAPDGFLNAEKEVKVTTFFDRMSSLLGKGRS